MSIDDTLLNARQGTRVDHLEVYRFPSRYEMGRAAAADIAAELRRVLDVQASARVVFAAAPSQDAMLQELSRAPDIDWARVTALHMDEYVNLPALAPQSFGTYLRERLFDLVHPGTVELIDGTAEPQEECRRYSDVLAAAPIDIVCLGIGENGHVAFNDPPTADFDDPESVRLVQLDAVSRMQQVNDGCFERMRDVPEHAITLTVPALLSGRRLFCTVPGAAKAEAVRQTLYGPVEEACPASALRRHDACTLYLDAESAVGVAPS